jgi:2-polyprenyl-3-methyl-5-hydroxy-6-metoxy-1,4-benzoquinol methylase
MVAGAHGSKRKDTQTLDDVQALSREWWESTPMTYDWRRGNVQQVTSDWLDDQDRRFLDAASFYATDNAPFDRFIPFADLEGKDVLEIGVGSGLHAELMARAGARVVGIDLTRAAVERTRQRFALRGLQGRFFQCDAERPALDFRRRFDFIWSWGVIHHSARTALIVRHMHEWLREDGTFAGMVYHRDSINAAALLMFDWIGRRGLAAHSVDEALWRGTDGYMARFYPAEQWRDLLLGFFRDASVEVVGQKSDALPFPRPLRRVLLPVVPDRAAQAVLHRFGSFVAFRARRPLSCATL